MSASQLRASLENDAVIRVLNQKLWDEYRYLIILHACSRVDPYALKEKRLTGFQGFPKGVMRDLAKEFGLDFEFYHGANNILEERLEKMFGYVKTFEFNNYTYYAITPTGTRIANSALGRAIKVALTLETISLPATLVEKVKEDLRKRAKEKGLDHDLVGRLLEEYEDLDAIPYTEEVPLTAKATRIKLRKDTMSIGRDLSNARSFPSDRYMSRKHAQVDWRDGTWWIRDLDSKNGTWRIDKKGVRKKVDREQLVQKLVYLVGSTKLIFVE